MGVSGSGKTSVARQLADALEVRFVEGDRLHPQANIDKMAAGEPLTDDDRWPWLDRVAAELRRPPVVVTCSALKRSYRDRLRRAGDVLFADLVLSQETATRRVAGRDGHFMESDMVASQFEALEPPPSDEPGVIRVDAEPDLASVVDATVRAVRDRLADRPVGGDRPTSDAIEFEVVDPQSPAALASMNHYFDELDERFVHGFDPRDTLVADADAMRAPTGCFVVAFDAGTAVACGGVVHVDATTAEIKRMWVDPTRRGVGLGRLMLATLEQHAARLGHVRVVLDTNAVLTEAISMYERAGYAPTSRYNDNPYAQRWFEKSLGATTTG